MKTIEEAIASYLQDLGVGQSRQTVETYSQGLERFKEFLVGFKVSPAGDAACLSADHAIGFAQWLAETHLTKVGRIAKASLRTYLASVSRLYAYLLREKIVELSASDLERIRAAYRNYRRGYHRPLPKLPSEEAVRELILAARRVKAQPNKPRLESVRLRNIAMLEALRASGMRVGELVGLKRDDIDYRTHSARVTGKGSKQRIVYFDDTAWNSIQAYLKQRGDGAKGRALYLLPVFARHDKRSGKRILPLTTDAVRLVFDELAKDANLEVAMTPHSLRHAFATKVLEATGDLALVQDMLGHSSPATTRIYAKVSSKRMRQAHRTAFGYQREDEEKD